ncbi:MAG: hypothetical protein IPO32_04775 [Crocinitomicaceae bacterium]|nr:hypothetical protein [Crocinitomicaceae bacterium]
MRYPFYLIPIVLLFACQSQPENSSDAENEISETINDTLVPDQNVIVADSNATQSSDFNWNEEGFNKEFNLRAYINDPDDTEPTNMRKSPNGKIIQKLPQGEDYMFHIIAQNNEWFQIKDLICFSEEIQITETTGWIHSSVVGASNRACTKKGSPVYKYPVAEDSLLVGYVPMESSIRIKQLYYDYVEIDFKTETGKSKSGWMHQDCVCGNPVTTCP